MITWTNLRKPQEMKCKEKNLVTDYWTLNLLFRSHLFLWNLSTSTEERLGTVSTKYYDQNQVIIKNRTPSISKLLEETNCQRFDAIMPRPNSSWYKGGCRINSFLRGCNRLVIQILVSVSKTAESLNQPYH